MIKHKWTFDATAPAFVDHSVTCKNCGILQTVINADEECKMMRPASERFAYPSARGT